MASNPIELIIGIVFVAAGLLHFIWYKDMATTVTRWFLKPNRIPKKPNLDSKLYVYLRGVIALIIGIIFLWRAFS